MKVYAKKTEMRRWTALAPLALILVVGCATPSGVRLSTDVEEAIEAMAAYE